MLRFILTFFFVLAGLVLGGILGFYGLFGIVWLLSLGLEDQTGLGWTWVLAFVTVPVGSLFGSFLGYKLNEWIRERYNLIGSPE